MTGRSSAVARTPSLTPAQMAGATLNLNTLMKRLEACTSYVRRFVARNDAADASRTSPHSGEGWNVN